ncbi:MAG: ATP-grasp domain-containing protein [Candidatus Riflebacteria bacterium]|nr:ATP-grasp domain-containing protein [Candidatus Riflebacteria bacterium]
MATKSLRIALIYNSHAPGDPVVPADRASFDDLMAMLKDILRTLRRLGHRPTLVPLGHDLLNFQRRLSRLNPDVVFNQYEDTQPGATFEMRTAALVRMLGYPLTGSPALALGLTKSKYACACLLAGAGILIPSDTRLIETIGAVDHYRCDFPVIVRPSSEDGGVGVDRLSVVHTRTALRAKVRELLKRDRHAALVQRFLPGREFNVAVLGGARPVVLPLAEVDYSQLPDHIPPIMSYAAKWVESSLEYKATSVTCPAIVDPELEKRIKGVALQVFGAVGAWGYARVDMRLAARDQLYVLEVNCNPCLERGIGLARCAAASGIEYDQLIQRILRSALELQRHDSADLGGGRPIPARPQ